MVGHAQWEILPVVPNAGSADRISFPSAEVGYLAPSNGNIWKTMDAGQSWVKAYEQGELTGLEVYIFNDLFFTDEQRGFAVGYDFFGADYLILRTTDGGSSWSPYTYEFGFNIGQCWSLDFLDHQNGYVVGDWGRIFKTTDGGTSWLPLGTPSNTRLTDVDFVSPQLGWVLSIEGELMKTTDGAGTWQLQSTPVEFNRIQFLNADLGFAVGDSRFFKTTDGGANWLPVSEPLPAGTVEFQFIDSQNGFSFVGNRAIITNDGGQTWFYQQVRPNLASGDFGGFNDISILNEHVGYMAGFQNNAGLVNTLLAQTENGGGIGLQVELSDYFLACPGNDPVTVTPRILGVPDSLEWFLNDVPLSLSATPQTFTGPWLSDATYIVKLRAIRGDQAVEVERSLYVGYQPNTADYAWVTFQTPQPACYGQSAQVFTNYSFTDQLQLRQGNEIVAGPFSINSNASGNYFNSPQLFETSNIFTVEIITPCGPVVIGDVELFAHPAIDIALPISSPSDPVLCKPGNIIEVQVANTVFNNGYQLYRNGNPQAFAFQNGNGGTIQFTTESFDSTSLFTVLVYGNSNCVAFLGDALLVEVERPSAAFGTNGLNLEAGTPVEIYFAGQEAVSFEWNFGLNATPADDDRQNPPPIHYAGETATQIRLVVEAPLGCRDTFVQNIGLYTPVNLNEYWAMEADISHQFLILGQNLEVDVFGNVYLDGSLSSANPSQAAQAVLPSQAGANGLLNTGRGVVLKYDPFGVLKWYLEFSGQNYGIRDIETDSAGNCYVPIGHGNAYIIGSTDGRRRIVQGTKGSSIVKYDPNGRVIWVAEVNACLWEGPSILDVELDAQGYLYVFGTNGECIEFRSSDGSTGLVLNGAPSGWLAKYTPDGEVLWAKALQDAAGNAYIYGHSLRLDATGNIFICGETSAAVAKFNPAGEYLWSVNAIGEEIMAARNLDVDELGNVYVAGMFRGRVAFAGLPPIDLGLPQHGSDYDLFVLKVNSDGQPLWLKSGMAADRYSENTAIRCFEDELYVYGSFGLGQFEYDDLVVEGRSQQNAILLKMNAADGSYLAHRLFDVPNPDVGRSSFYACYGRTLAIDTAGRLHLLGNIGYEADFENDTLHSTNYLYIAKTAGLSTVNAVSDHFTPLTWTAYLAPNPASETVRLHFHSQQAETLTVTISDILGKRLALFQKMNIQPGEQTLELPIDTGAPAGIYWARLQADDGAVLMLKLVKK